MNSTIASALFFAAACGLTLTAAAATKVSEAQLRYNQDRAKCMRGDTNQDRATCMKEAGAALEDSKRQTLASAPDGELARNRLMRCEGLPAADRQECVARMNEGSSSGSAQQGGMLRELTTTTTTTK